MNKAKICKDCGKQFTPNKFHPHQQYCGFPECSRERKNSYLRGYGEMWRRLHPEYFRKYKRRRREAT